MLKYIADMFENRAKVHNNIETTKLLIRLAGVACRSVSNGIDAPNILAKEDVENKRAFDTKTTGRPPRDHHI